MKNEIRNFRFALPCLALVCLISFTMHLFNQAYQTKSPVQNQFEVDVLLAKYESKQNTYLCLNIKNQNDHLIELSGVKTNCLCSSHAFNPSIILLPNSCTSLVIHGEDINEITDSSLNDYRLVSVNGLEYKLGISK